MQIIINAAGFGSRLGLSMCKARVDINGAPLLHWQIAALRSVFPTEKILVVIGFQAKEVALEVGERKGVHYVFNPYFEQLGVVKSVYMATKSGHYDAADSTLRLDGDLLLTDPVSISRLCNSNVSSIAIQRREIPDEVPVVTLMENRFDKVDIVHSYTGELEWPCIEYYVPSLLTQMMRHPQFMCGPYYKLINHCNQLALHETGESIFRTFPVCGVKEIDHERDLERTRNFVRDHPTVLDFASRLSSISAHTTAPFPRLAVAGAENQESVCDGSGLR